MANKKIEKFNFEGFPEPDPAETCMPVKEFYKGLRESEEFKHYESLQPPPRESRQNPPYGDGRGLGCQKKIDDSNADGAESNK